MDESFGKWQTKEKTTGSRLEEFVQIDSRDRHMFDLMGRSQPFIPFLNFFDDQLRKLNKIVTHFYLNYKF